MIPAYDFLSSSCEYLLGAFGLPFFRLGFNDATMGRFACPALYSFIKDNYADFPFQFVEGLGKNSIAASGPEHNLSEVTGGPLIERRTARRFQVDWQIRVESGGDSGGRVIFSGALHNISSSGALLSVSNPLSTGTQLDVYVKLPLDGKKWMKYPAHVVRIELGTAAGSAAVRFDAARPVFGVSLVAV